MATPKVYELKSLNQSSAKQIQYKWTTVHYNPTCITKVISLNESRVKNIHYTGWIYESFSSWSCNTLLTLHQVNGDGHGMVLEICCSHLSTDYATLINSYSYSYPVLTVINWCSSEHLTRSIFIQHGNWWSIFFVTNYPWLWHGNMAEEFATKLTDAMPRITSWLNQCCLQLILTKDCL